MARTLTDALLCVSADFLAVTPLSPPGGVAEVFADEATPIRPVVERVSEPPSDLPPAFSIQMPPTPASAPPAAPLESRAAQAAKRRNPVRVLLLLSVCFL